MAPLSLILLLLLSCSCLHTQARESKFFSKAIHIHSTAKSVEETKPESPLPSREDAPVVSPTQTPEAGPYNFTAPAGAPASSESGYGLYGHGSGSYESEATVGDANDSFENETLAEEELNDNDRTEKEEYTNNNNYYNNKENVYSNGYNLYGSNNNGYSESYSSSSGRQGMSDTRFMENGKYFYDTSRDAISHDQNAFDQTDEKQSSYTTTAGGPYEIENSQYDPNYSKYVFNTMEDYYKSQGYHENSPEAYIP
ncbi:hypothetical protein SAY86_028952 [Trapa natans]|uniref:Protein E6-like n=1 Tax=Trapa natans TaxID=22666 RepID=A0AAN7MJZ0_TRANT|nr:hypothetical protein SAY86_028952 [Trapa natans]